MKKRINSLRECEISYWKLMESYQGWQAYVKLADSFKLRKKILREIHKVKEKRLNQIKTYKYLD